MLNAFFDRTGAHFRDDFPVPCLLSDTAIQRYNKSHISCAWEHRVLSTDMIQIFAPG